MAGYAPVPPELQKAIDRASAKYQVPPDLLAGIWRVESGSTYPNPAVNSSGYGGLFGTKAWDAPAQKQADLAASILAEGLRQSGGNIAEALSFYNSGKLQGGYTSVPGETTFGNVQAPTSVPPPGSGGDYTAPPRPGGTGSAQDVGLWGDITGGIGDAGSWFGHIAGSAGNWLTGGVADVLKVFTAFLWLANPINWLRAFEAFLSLVLILLGLYFFGQAEESSDVDMAALLKDPKRLGKGAAGGASSAGRRAASGSLVGRTARTAAKVAK